MSSSARLINELKGTHIDTESLVLVKHLFRQSCLLNIVSIARKHLESKLSQHQQLVDDLVYYFCLH